MLEFTFGQKTNVLAVDQLVKNLQDVEWTGSLYFGYPLLATIENTLLIDALLTCKEHGLVVFHFLNSEFSGTNDWKEIKEKQDEIYNAIDVKLRQFPAILNGRELPFDIHIISINPNDITTINDGSILITSFENLVDEINHFEPINEDSFKKINAAIQRITTLKPTRKRLNVSKEDSRGSKLKEIEGGIANLDQWQKKAAIEYPEGVQRIRGLAGSGKTIVLALKAAYLHTAHPDWNIVITYHSRSLTQQFVSLIRRFTFEHTNDEPNWEKISVINTWGGSADKGVYSEIAIAHEISPQSFLEGKRKYSYDLAFEGVCRELIDEVGRDNFKQIYDAVLIDEAQDLPQSFFELVYLVTKDPKRIIYAYDELQNLSDYSMAPPEILFGKNADGTPKVRNLPNNEGNPKQDIVLPICYRNTSWALATAHALGFGIYRNEGLVQFFDNPKLLNEVGYETLSGNLELGEQVTIRRRIDSSPDYFSSLNPQDAIIFKLFNDKESQAKYLASEIKKNLEEDELEFQDILIIIPDPLTSKSEASLIFNELNNVNIPSHLAGVTSSRDQLFSEDSVAITNIFRAKGNEASMVYVINADYSFRGYELAKRRNILFTAITRSKAWVRIFGCGPDMEGLISEAKKVADMNYQFLFQVPSPLELQTLRRIHRDRTIEEKKEYKNVESSLSKFIKLVLNGEMLIENLPPEMQSQLAQIFRDLNDDSKKIKK